MLDWVALLGTGPKGYILSLRASACPSRVPLLLLIVDKSPGNSRKSGLGDSRALVSMPGPGEESSGRLVLLALVTSES